MHRVNKPITKRGVDENDIRDLQVFFYYRRGYSYTKVADKFGLNAGHIYNIRVKVEDNFWSGAYKILGCKVGPTKTRPDTNWLQIRVKIKKSNKESLTKTFCYDYSKKGVDLLEDYIKEELMRQ